jgi:hypothetical protein
MESGCSVIELAGMNLVPGECRENAEDAVKRYREEYLNWRVPNHQIVTCQGYA